MMKKGILFIMLFFFITGCKKEDEVVAIPLSVINTRMTPIEFEMLPSVISMETELIADTLKCTILTILINKDDTLKDITSESLKNNLYIEVNSSPNEWLLGREYWAAHEISFDIVGIKPNISNVVIKINGMERLSIEIDLIQ